MEITMRQINKVATGLGMAAMLSTTLGLASPSSAMRAPDATETFGQLTALNNSGVKGQAEATVKGRRVVVDVDAHKLVKGVPHAQHIHYGAAARNECPQAFDDQNGDHQLTTSDGAAAYGPIKISLTTGGDTSAKSGLAVDRFPTAPNGNIHYNRITKTSKGVARAIRRGEAVYVLHGVDYNGNGTYDFDGNGKSELDPSLPGEATDPAACTVLKVQN
jgi:hypothetical protein